MQIIVMGFSLAGIAAAQRSVMLGSKVLLLEDFPGETTISDRFLFGRNSVRSGPVNGATYYLLARQSLQDAGVDIESGDFTIAKTIILESDRIEIRDPFGLRLSGDALVFAPNGKNPGLNQEWSAVPSEMVSFSAWSDGGALAGKNAIVVGEGHRAAEQALILSEHRARVSLIIPTNSLSSDLARYVAFDRNVSIEHGSLLEVKCTNGSVRVEFAEPKRIVTAQHVFAANDPVLDWSLFGGKAAADGLVAHQRMYLAGVAAGCTYADEPGQWQSGVEAAIALNLHHRA